MWPFSSSNGKDSSELVKELPNSLKDFFEKNNPDSKFDDIFEVSPQQKRVSKILEKTGAKALYSYEFDRYKSRETVKVAAAVNCAELQQKVVECIRGWSYTAGNQCGEEVKTHTSCIEIQNDALKRLFYTDCYNVDQCQKIRFVIDQLFTQHFGQYGERITPENQEKFGQDVDKAFYKIWK